MTATNRSPDDPFRVIRVDPLSVLSQPERQFVELVARQHPAWRRGRLRIVVGETRLHRKERYVAQVKSPVAAGDRVKVESTWEFLWQRVVGTEGRTQERVTLRAVDAIVLIPSTRN
jgi:hypothetical protein